MNIKKITHLSENVIKDYKEGDPVMVRKAVSIKDIGYRKDDPARELWHAEMSLDHDFYLVTLAVASAAILLSWGICRMVKKKEAARCRKKCKG